MDNGLYWVWLTTRSGFTSDKITAILDYFEDAKEIYEADKAAYSGIYGLTQTELCELEDKNLDGAEKILRRTAEAGARILTYDDINYPDMLRRIPSPPYVLYVKGEIMDWDRILGIGVVGTRRCTDYGRMAAENICSGLARAGVTVISGMARGIDSLAAVCALKQGNKTIAVLGTGIDVVYPPENGALMQKIAENGAVITEYPPGARALPHHFPERNRIISGLARGTLVIEAPMKSGSLITANLAIETGKDLFAVPGDINRANSAGCNMLITRGAKLVTKADDLLEEYVYELQRIQRSVLPDTCKEHDVQVYTVPNEARVGDASHARINNVQQISAEDKCFSELNAEEKKIISILIKGNSGADEISRQLEKPMSELNSMLVVLEMKGFIGKLPGNNFKLNI